MKRAFEVGRTLLLVSFVGCSNVPVGNIIDSSSSSGRADPSGSGSTTSGGAGGGSMAGAEQLCVDTINQYRATLGLSPYERWTGAELCADGQSQSDSMTMTAHGAFGQCG